MPVKKQNSMMEKECLSLKHCGSHKSPMGRIFFTLLGVIMVYAIILLGTMIKNNVRQYMFIGKAPKQERTLSLQAEGKVTVIPDVALINIGMISDGKTVDEAQSKNTVAMNNLINQLKEFGVAKNDIQTTNYSIYPQYKYTDEDGSVLTGYGVNQSVVIKVRDVSKVGETLSLAGKSGANTISGPVFKIDDTQKYKNEARNKALEKVKENMIQLSRSLGVNFVDIISYNEYESNFGDLNVYDAKAIGMGGGSGMLTVEPGNQEVVLNVNMLFEIK